MFRYEIGLTVQDLNVQIYIQKMCTHLSSSCPNSYLRSVSFAINVPVRRHLLRDTGISAIDFVRIIILSKLLNNVV